MAERNKKGKTNESIAYILTAFSKIDSGFVSSLHITARLVAEELCQDYSYTCVNANTGPI